MKKYRLPLFITLFTLLFLYLPVITMMVNSFNASRMGGHWGGWSFIWYKRLFLDEGIWEALQNTLIIGLLAAFFSTALGTLAAFCLHSFNSKLQSIHKFFIYTPLILPEIQVGISLLLVFILFQVSLGITSILLSHITFCLSYVTLVMLARLENFDFSVVEAAQDLGATWPKIIQKILLPLLKPGLLAGGLLAFTLSMDDFVITFFVAGSGTTTLPLYIYGMMKHGAPPLMNALSTLLVFFTLIVVGISYRLIYKED